MEDLPRLPPRSQQAKNSEMHKLTQRMAVGIGSAGRGKSSARTTLEEVEKAGRAKDLERRQTRRWKQGDVYAPHDLSAIEMQKWSKRTQPSVDVFDILAINPINEWKVCQN